MRSALRLPLLLLLLAPASALAQTPEISVQQTLERARQAGIPVELLESKIAEGRAKGVPLSRIALAVERRLEALERARATVDGRHQYTTEELGVAGDALTAGVSVEVLRTLSETAPRDRRAVAIAALSQLVSLGQAPEEALQRVTQALRSGPEALMNLPAQAAAAAGRRGPPPAGVPARGKPPGKPGNQGNNGN